MGLFFPPGMTNPMTTGGDLIYGGSNGVGTRLANGTAGSALLSSGGTSAPVWGYGSVTSVKTSDYTIGSADTVVRCSSSGGAFHVTFPDTATYPGKEVTILLTAAGANAGVDLRTTNSQTIGGLASTVIILNTVGDYITIVSDGANWQIINWGITVSALYTGQPTGTINGSTDNVFPTKVIDPNTDYNTSTGTWTARYAGKHTISVSAYVTLTTGSFTAVQIYKNGAPIRVMQFPYPSNFSNTVSTPITVAGESMAAGDTVNIRFNANGSPVFSSTAPGSWFSIIRTGW